MRTTVLFADPDHGPRAQMAAAVLRRVDTAGTFEVSSAGSARGGDLTGVAEVLADRGVSFVPASQQLDLSMAPDILIGVRGGMRGVSVPAARRSDRPLALRRPSWPRRRGASGRAGGDCGAA